MLCLVCDKPDKVLISISSLPKRLLNVFDLISDIETIDTDLICLTCNDELKIVCQFREKCITSQSYLQRKLDLPTAEIKIEDDEPIGQQSVEWLAESESDQGEEVEEIVDESLPSTPLADNKEQDEETIDAVTEEPKPKPPIAEISSIADPKKRREWNCGCGQSFPTKNGYYKHKREKHPAEYGEDARKRVKKSQIPNDIYDVAGFNKQTCRYCFERWADVPTRIEHEKTHANESRPYKCPTCSKTFKRRPEIRIHFLSHDPQKRFVCLVEGCERMFKNRNSLTVHQRKHFNSKPFQCSECGGLYAENGSLKSHIIRKHRKPAPNFGCTLCPKKFVLKQSLRIHLKRHDYDARRFDCSICKKKFFTKYKLERHILIHSGEKPFKCPVCPFASTSNYNLKRHVQIHSLEKKLTKAEEMHMKIIECSKD